MECLACKKKFTDRTAWQVHCRECRKDCDPELENSDDWIVRLRPPDTDHPASAQCNESETDQC